jgi:GTP-binding protein HflX
MPKVHGNTSGLKTGQLRRLGNLYRRRLPPEALLRPEQATELARLSAELGREIGLVVSRRGEVEQVVAGGPESLPAPDLSRLRRGRARLAGHALIHTSPRPGLTNWDRDQLARRRWDLVASLEVTGEGLPGAVHAAHLLPRPGAGGELRELEPFAPGYPPEDLALLVRSLEEELARAVPAEEVAAGDGALVISVTTGSKAEAAERLDELAQLAGSAGLRVVGREIQRRAKPDPRTILGPGKLAQVLVKALRLGARWLVFDQELSPSQAHALAESTEAELKFIDRTQLILDIFAQRAQSREGKLQVEMAQLRYLAPRLSTRDDGLSRLTGGIGGRGPGETRLEIDRRRVRQRLAKLEKELKSVAGQRQRRRERRQKAGLPVLSIVGYTNAGKSTLLNALTGSEVLAENRLFATLDPTTRRLRFPREREVIVTDTVGFIRDLPRELAKAFAATLEELDQADVLLHVADASHPQVEEQIEAVERLLDGLEISQAPRLVVLNKTDRAPAEVVERLRSRFGGVPVCAREPATLPPLLEAIEERVFPSGGLEGGSARQAAGQSW